MDTIDRETKEQILNRTLEVVRTRNMKRARRKKHLAFGSLLALVALGGAQFGLLVKTGEEPRVVVTVPEVPALVVEIEDVPMVWEGARSLVLVVNEHGMEMKALNESQVAALARKPGCEFVLTPDAGMWISECAVGGDGFSPGVEF